MKCCTASSQTPSATFHAGSLRSTHSRFTALGKQTKTDEYLIFSKHTNIFINPIITYAYPHLANVLITRTLSSVLCSTVFCVPLLPPPPILYHLECSGTLQIFWAPHLHAKVFVKPDGEVFVCGCTSFRVPRLKLLMREESSLKYHHCINHLKVLATDGSTASCTAPAPRNTFSCLTGLLL